ncbi:MAG: hypothetical protein K2L64_03260 [Ureaplasma sp.]|nr:hypothetical protein [Ureaplasma sp.]
MKSSNTKNRKVKYWLHKIFIGDTPAKKIFLFYLYAIILGIILLSLPISLKNSSSYEKVVYDDYGQLIKEKYTFIDILFTTVSAFTDTGLTSSITFYTYSWFGQIVILSLIQIGGFGLFTIYWCIWNIIFNNKFYKRRHNIDQNKTLNMGFSQSLLIFSERGNTKLGLTTKTIRRAIIFIFSVELIFWIFYSVYFAVTPAYESIQVSQLVENGSNEMFNSLFVDDTSKMVSCYQSPLSIWVGLFHSVSSINNAGFDIIGGSSLVPYRNGVGTVLQFATMIQIIIGGLGYPVIYDILTKIKCSFKKIPHRLSIFSKLTLISYFVIFAFGIIFLFSFELSLKTGVYNTLTNPPDEYKSVMINYFGKSGVEQNWNLFSNLLFNVTSVRSAGFSTISQSSLSIPGKWVVIVLMFIGCSHSSTGGGIRGITIAIIFLAFISRIKGSKQVVAFKRSISKETIIDAFIVLTIAFSMVTFCSLIFFGFWEQDNITFTDMLFDWISAFSTTGVSTGVTSKILSNPMVAGVFFVIVMSLVMIIGQLGISTTMLSFRKEITKSNAIKYPMEELKI